MPSTTRPPRITRSCAMGPSRGAEVLDPTLRLRAGLMPEAGELCVVGCPGGRAVDDEPLPVVAALPGALLPVEVRHRVGVPPSDLRLGEGTEGVLAALP